MIPATLAWLLVACSPETSLTPALDCPGTLDVPDLDALASAAAPSADDPCVLELTPAERHQAGAGFYTAAELDARDFSLCFEFWIGGGDAVGADGLTFTLFDAPPAGEWPLDEYVGASGSCLGYSYLADDCHNSTAPTHAGLTGLTLEVDTFANEHDLPSAVLPAELEPPQLAIVFDADILNPAWQEPLETLLDAERWHQLCLEVSAPTVRVTMDEQHFEFTLEGRETDFDFRGWPGFTASTGEHYSGHAIQNINVDENSWVSD